MASSDLQSVLIVAGFILAAFLPPVLYLVWVRNTERYAREPWGRVVKAFAWGAIGGVIVGVILTLVLDVPSTGAAVVGAGLWTAVVAAPIAEEFAKALGLRWVRDDHPEPEDGIIYGAAAGLGFAATENLLYTVNAFLTGGFGVFVMTLIVRSVASALLHASASAFVGFGIWRARLGHGGFAGIVGFYLIAVFLHALFNLAASLQLLAALLFAIVLAVGVFGYLRRRIRAFDAAIAQPVER